MKTFILGGLLACLGGAAACAQGAPAANWSGFYVGGHAGTTVQTGRMSLVPTVDEEGPEYDTPLDPNFASLGFRGGLLAGYNWQFDRYVVGVEADIGFGQSLSHVMTAKDDVPLNVWETANKPAVQTNGHVRARAGIADGRLLVFASAGIAVADTHFGIIGYCPPDIYPAQASKVLAGPSFGAGVEYAFTDHIIGRAEYLFDYFGTPGYSAPDYQVRHLGDYSNHSFRVAASYRF